MTDIISEILTWMNGLGDAWNKKDSVEISYSQTKSVGIDSTYPLKFNSEPQVSRLHPVYTGPVNPPRNGIKFNI
jgi:hypothetical protein